MTDATAIVQCPFCLRNIPQSALMVAGSAHRVGACTRPESDYYSFANAVRRLEAKGEFLDCPAAEGEWQ